MIAMFFILVFLKCTIQETSNTAINDIAVIHLNSLVVPLVIAQPRATTGFLPWQKNRGPDETANPR
jgi:hypothetical protein